MLFLYYQNTQALTVWLLYDSQNATMNRLLISFTGIRLNKTRLDKTPYNRKPHRLHFSREEVYFSITISGILFCA